MKIYIVILNYRNTATTIRCIRSLFEEDGGFSRIILVNNDTDSFDERQLKQYKKHIDIINNYKNLGFAGGVNVGIRYALSQKADAVLLINNDTVLQTPVCKPLGSFLEKHTDVGIVGPVIEFEKNGKTVFDLGGYVNLFWGRTYHHELTPSNSPLSGGEQYSSLPDKGGLGWVKNFPVHKVPYMSGCCMMIKREVFEKTGLFDEDYFLYYEDVDFCLRARAKGYKTVVLPSVIITHELSKTIGKISPLAIYHQTRSGLLFGKKHMGNKRFLNIVFLLAQSFLFLKKDPKNGRYAFKAMRDSVSAN